jgi:hypothetical protein
MSHSKMKRHDLYKRGRSCPVSCLSFGENRKTEYPDFFFCNGCDLLEDAVKNGGKRAHRQQKKYMCTGGHTELSHPTTKKKHYRPNLKKTQPSVASIPSAAVTQRCQQEDQESRWKDNDLMSTTTVPSQTSPCKKKQRRTLEESTPMAQNRQLHRHQQQGKETPESGSMIPYFVTPSPAVQLNEGSVKEEELMACIESLKIKNVLLQKRIAELDSSKEDLATRVEILTSQMEGLQFPAAGKEACGNSRAASHVESNEASDHGDDNGGGRRGSDPQQGKRLRIQQENEELSQQLALIINDFVVRSLSNRSKFPTSRIARIVIQSVLSFEWTHSEFARVASKQAIHNGTVRDVFGAALTPLLNVMSMKRHSHKSKASLLVECIWDDNFLDGEVKEQMISKVRSYL